MFSSQTRTSAPVSLKGWRDGWQAWCLTSLNGWSVSFFNFHDSVNKGVRYDLKCFIQTKIVFQKLLLDMVEEKSDGDMERAIEWLWVGGYIRLKTI